MSHAKKLFQEIALPISFGRSCPMSISLMSNLRIGRVANLSVSSHDRMKYSKLMDRYSRIFPNVKTTFCDNEAKMIW